MKELSESNRYFNLYVLNIQTWGHLASTFPGIDGA